MFDWNVVKQRVEALWSEFRIPMWVTEFDWNGDGEEVDFRDYTEYASILENFYTLMFRQEVQQSIFLSYHETSSFSPSSGSWPGAPLPGTPRRRLPTYLNLYHQRWRSSGGRIQYQLQLCP